MHHVKRKPFLNQVDNNIEKFLLLT